jgi:hypothetical protein
MLGEIVEREGQRAPLRFSGSGQWRASKRCVAGAAFGRRQDVVSTHVRDSGSAGGTGRLVLVSALVLVTGVDVKRHASRLSHSNAGSLRFEAHLCH